MNCENHKDTEAVGACAYCGKFFCKDCLVEVKGRNYCKEDVGKAFDEISNHNNQGAISITNVASNSGAYGLEVPRKNKMVALVLCIFGGIFGLHRFYVGRTGSGFLYLCTFGVFLLGYVLDLISILTDGFCDRWGRPLK